MGERDETHNAEADRSENENFHEFESQEKQDEQGWSVTTFREILCNKIRGKL